MSTTYEIFDRASANVVGVYDTAEAAMDVLASAVTRGLGQEFGTIVLGEEDEEGRTRVIADGVQLVRLALAWADARRQPIHTAVKRDWAVSTTTVTGTPREAERETTVAVRSTGGSLVYVD
jgi:hypothetical protein